MVKFVIISNNISSYGNIVTNNLRHFKKLLGKFDANIGIIISKNASNKSC